MICDYCGQSFSSKTSLIKHINAHDKSQKPQIIPRTERFPCFECNMEFMNKGLLMCHNAKVHVPKRTVLERKQANVCPACQISFYHQKHLKYHIRSCHFNLLSHTPYCEFKKVNQVWFEKVLNCNNIVEIKKTAQNSLLMRKLDTNTSIKVGDHSTESVDLRGLYPTEEVKTIRCSYCLKMYDKGYINRHVYELHLKRDKETIRK